MTGLYEPELVGVIERALRRVRHGLERASPPMAAVMDRWFEKLAGTRPLVDYFTHLQAFPIALFPWWMETRLSGKHDLDFQEDLAHSSFSGYLYIRLIDNIMDEPEPAEIGILPLENYFHSEFQSVYHKYFPFDDDFWDIFHRIWMQSAEASLLDARQDSIDERGFLKVAAQKTCAGKIPLAAVCRRHHVREVPDSWSRAFELTAAFHQLSNDLFDFQRDLEVGNATWFLFEGRRRKYATETMPGWVIREGFEWGIHRLELWLEELARCAGVCGSPGLKTYVELRAGEVRARSCEVSESLQIVKRVLALEP